jgi:hypothetical protein
LRGCGELTVLCCCAQPPRAAAPPQNAGAGEARQEARQEALQFKVMRLNRPHFYTGAACAGLSLLGGGGAGAGAGLGAEVGNSDMLCFPAGFGNIYLGETFQAYISACNNGAQQLTRLEVRAEIQTGTKRLPLLEAQAQKTLLPSFAPRQCVDFVVSHELKEAGVHIMICSGSYLEASGEEKKVRQYFKFQVQKPLSVTTKLQFLNNSILLENQIQNMTKASLALDAIKFEPTAHYIRHDLTQGPPDTVTRGVLRACILRRWCSQLVCARHPRGRQARWLTMCGCRRRGRWPT